jgi:hypothetical protein
VDDDTNPACHPDREEADVRLRARSRLNDQFTPV